MRARLAAVMLVPLAAGIGSQAWADNAPPVVHPIYAQLPELAEDEGTRRVFAAAVAHYKLGPLEVVDVPAPTVPASVGALKGTIATTLKVAFNEALPLLNAAAADAAATGGAGLSTAELAELYLYRAMATARADWNAPAAPPVGATGADEARARAFNDYLRAAALAPEHPLNPRELPPQVVADFRRAVDEVRRRLRGTLEVRGPADARVSLDGAEPLPLAGGLVFRDVPYGEHLLAVDELGHVPWGTQVTLGTPTLQVSVPERAALGLDDAAAAAHARRMGAKFALVGERKPGPGARLQLRLVDANGIRRNAALVSTTEEHGAVDAAVMRLDEEARRIQAGLVPVATPPLGAPSSGEPAPVLLEPLRPPRATFQQDPAAWARDRWPLFTAIGVLVGAAVVLGVVAHN